MLAQKKSILNGKVSLTKINLFSNKCFDKLYLALSPFKLKAGQFYLFCVIAEKYCRC